MKFCEDEINWTELIDIFQEIYNKTSDMESLEVLQAIALARVLKSDIEEFLDRLTAISLKGIICQVLSNYDIDEEIGYVADTIQEMFDKFNQFDDAIASIDADGFNSLEEIQDAVEPLLESFISEKDSIKELIDEQLKKLFSPLTELGASQSDIDSAFEEVEFSDSPTEYITEIFFTITDSTLQNIS